VKNGSLEETSAQSKPSVMDAPFNYTTIFAPLGFFIGGIFLVLLLNRFIGKSQNKKSN
jgi:formate/nitrite transporter FocA (FNT family)